MKFFVRVLAATVATGACTSGTQSTSPTNPATTENSIAATTTVTSTTITDTSSTHPTVASTIASLSDVTGPAAASAPCGHNQLRLGHGEPITEPSGMNTVPLTITNDGTSPCYLLGYPTIAMYDRNGTVLSFVYTHTGDMVVTARPPSRVDLTPGSSAFATINKYRCDLGPGPHAISLALIAPGDTTPWPIALLQYATLDFCGPGDPGSIVAVSPVAATLTATLNAGTG